MHVDHNRGGLSGVCGQVSIGCFQIFLIDMSLSSANSKRFWTQVPGASLVPRLHFPAFLALCTGSGAWE